MYVDASSQCNDLSAVVASSQTTTNREWNIKVTQVECNSKLLPPTGCLQYFTGTTGFMYNYGWQGSTVNGASTTAHLSDQDYTMCIRREEGYCSMSYSATATTGFSVSTSPATVSAIFGDVACTTDYLRIPGLQDSGSTSATAFVGREAACAPTGSCRAQVHATAAGSWRDASRWRWTHRAIVGLFPHVRVQTGHIRCDARGLPDAHNGFDSAACTTRRCCDVCVYLLGMHRG